MRTAAVSTLLAALLLAAPVASAGPTDVAIHVTRLGGDTVSAQPFVDRFLRYIEARTGWKAGSAKGQFLVTRKDVAAFVADAKPGIGMMEPGLFLEMRKAWDLRPILQVDSTELVSPRLHVVAKDPAIQGLADLKGKRLWTLLADCPAYLSKVVLDGKASASDFQLKQIGQALRGAKAVLRGDADATILDDEQLASAKQITGGQDLRAVFSSPALPAIPVVVFGDALSAADRDALSKTLKSMCQSPEGTSICKEMHIGRFVPVDEAVLGDARKRFGE